MICFHIHNHVIINRIVVDSLDTVIPYGTIVPVDDNFEIGDQYVDSTFIKVDKKPSSTSTRTTS